MCTYCIDAQKNICKTKSCDPLKSRRPVGVSVLKDVHHFPPDLFNLLVDAIPLMLRSKRDVLVFFRGAGVGPVVLSDLEKQEREDRDRISKYEIVRTVLLRINEGGNKYLRERREILKRVVEFEDFSTCWPDDRLKAIGLVSRIREVINVKDYSTRMRQEHYAEVRKNREAQRTRVDKVRRHRSELDQIRKDLNSLFTMTNPQKRGRLLESVLNRLFRAAGILVREDFRRVPELGQGVIEQIDGIVEFDSHIYLVEMKWLNKPVSTEELTRHLGQVLHHKGSRGIFISYSGYTSQAIAMCKEWMSQIVVVLCTLEEFVRLLEKRRRLRGVFQGKGSRFNYR